MAFNDVGPLVQLAPGQSFYKAHICASTLRFIAMGMATRFQSCRS
jgi:hypothetical protein